MTVIGIVSIGIMFNLPVRHFKACKLVSLGYSNQEIAEKMNLNYQQVCHLLYFSYKKLSCTRGQLVSLFFNNADNFKFTEHFYNTDQQLCVRYYQKNLSYKDISNLLGISRNRVSRLITSWNKGIIVR